MDLPRSEFHSSKTLTAPRGGKGGGGCEVLQLSISATNELFPKISGNGLPLYQISFIHNTLYSCCFYRREGGGGVDAEVQYKTMT